MATDSQTININMEHKDAIAIGPFKVHVVAVENKGLALRVENQRKKAKNQYLQLKRGVRLNNETSLKLNAINNGVAEILLTHASKQGPTFLDGREGRLVVSRRRGQQLIVNGGEAIITISSITASRCAVWVVNKNKHREKVLVMGDAPITVMPNVKMAFMGFSSMDTLGAKLLTIAPKNIRIDRHEIHLKRELSVEVLNTKSQPKNNEILSQRHAC